MDIIFIQNGVLLDLDQEDSHVNQYTFRSEQDLGGPHVPGGGAREDV